MCTLLIENEFIQLSDNRFEHALEAVRDITLMEFVFDQMLASDREDKKFIDLMSKVVDDSILPQDDRKQSVGRNSQFELYIHALCRNAQMLPVTLDEPDVRCSVQGITFGVAAKRLKSIGKFKDRVAEAADQILKSKLPGFIALDTCIALNPDNQRVTTKILDDDFGILWEAALHRFNSDHHAWIQEAIRGKGVRGLVIHDHQVRWRSDANWELVGMTYLVETTRGNKRRSREANYFYKSYKKGLTNLIPCRLSDALLAATE